MLFIETLADAERWAKEGATEPATVQGVDLTTLDDAFAGLDVGGSAFVGCVLGDRLYARIRSDGAGLVTDLPALPASLPAFAPGIYTVADLYHGLAADGSGWEQTPDHDGFVFFNEKKNVPRKLEPLQAMAARLHDTVQEQAVRAFLHGRDVVAIMGGHDFKRQLTQPEIDAGKPDVYWLVRRDREGADRAGVHDPDRRWSRPHGGRQPRRASRRRARHHGRRCPRAADQRRL